MFSFSKNYNQTGTTINKQNPHFLSIKISFSAAKQKEEKNKPKHI